MIDYGVGLHKTSRSDVDMGPTEAEVLGAEEDVCYIFIDATMGRKAKIPEAGDGVEDMVSGHCFGQSLCLQRCG